MLALAAQGSSERGERTSQDKVGEDRKRAHIWLLPFYARPRI
jgi:hypothetical protein